MGEYKLSVVIPVKNGEDTLEQCLHSLSNQSIGKHLELIILDSMSVDRSREIAAQYGAILKDIPKGSFNHGLTRNIGVQLAHADLIYFTVQDAWIADEQLLEKMSRYFDDPTVQAVVGHQAIPPGHLDKNPALWFKRYTAPKTETRFFDPPSSFSALSKKQQFELSAWDNVIALYRKTALEKIPFRETNFSEDWLWANEALKNGMKIIRDPALVTYHYHHHRFGYTFRSKFIIHYHFFVFFQQVPSIPWSPARLLSAVHVIIKNKQLKTRKKLYWILHNSLMYLAAFLSALLFRTALFFGKGLLNKLYRIVCREVPQGYQPKPFEKLSKAGVKE